MVSRRRLLFVVKVLEGELLKRPLPKVKLVAVDLDALVQFFLDAGGGWTQAGLGSLDSLKVWALPLWNNHVALVILDMISVDLVFLQWRRDAEAAV